tara:strand:+ start:3524 stop:4531 length:1008 start_codon:yes stop_codon:yes gene_type:complete
MTSKKMFKKIAKCPFCGNKRSIRVSKQKLIRNFYVKEIVTDLKISFNFLQKNLQIKECSNCYSIYFSRWFNDYYKKKIFLTIYGQHNMGWQNFYDFKNKALTPNHGDLFSLLKKKIKILKYGEYGCPFNGLMFDMLKEEIKKERSIKKFINENMKHLAGKVRNFNTNNTRTKKKVKIPKVKRLYDRCFIIDSSHLIWGKNDISNNCSSLGLADKIFDLNLYDANEENLYKNKFDLFGFFMTLDHCENALSLLKNILYVSRYVIIHAHTNKQITAQHSFMFTKKIKNFLTRNKIFNLDLTWNIEKDPNRNKGVNYKSNEIYLLCSLSKKNIDKYLA